MEVKMNKGKIAVTLSLVFVLGTASVFGAADKAEAATQGWKKNSTGWWYSYSDGTYPVDSWKKISGKWYHFNKRGYMQTGWKKIDGEWYYLNSNGAMQTGWKKISGKWYYFGGNGVMRTGLVTVKGVDYFLNSDGVWVDTASDLLSAEVGDVITFGHYEQDGDESDGKEPIQWKVLNKDGDRLFVVSLEGLDNKKYNETYGDMTWEDSSIRSWLNNEFMSEAFTSVEKKMIPLTEVVNKDNKMYGTKGGNNTVDQVFLLSINEAEKYFGKDTAVTEGYPINPERACKATVSTASKGLPIADYSEGDLSEELIQFNGNCWWLLRSPGKTQSRAACVNFCGIISHEGYEVSEEDDAVRPAMWINP